MLGLIFSNATSFGKMIYVYTLHLALSHVLNVLSSLNYVSLSPVTFLALTFILFFPPHSTVSFPFKSEISIRFVLGTTVSYFSHYCLIIYFVGSNLTNLLGLFWYILSVFIQLLRYNSGWLLADPILFVCLLSSPKQEGIFEQPRSCGCYLYRADVALF